MNKQGHKILFNHPLIEIYRGISTEETKYKSGPIPNDIFSKYYTDLINKNTDLINNK